MKLKRKGLIQFFSNALIINKNILTNFWGRSIPRGSIFNELSYKWSLNSFSVMFPRGFRFSKNSYQNKHQYLKIDMSNVILHVNMKHWLWCKNNGSDVTHVTLQLTKTIFLHFSTFFTHWCLVWIFRVIKVFYPW